jgi:hypothetical protein
MAVSDRRRVSRRLDRASVSAERRGRDRRGIQRRQVPRVNLELWMEEISGEDVYFRHTGNVSEGGVYFDRAIPHPLGTTVTLKFALPGDREMFVARGQVVHGAGSSDGLGMAIMFISIEGDGKKRLKSHLRGM